MLTAGHNVIVAAWKWLNPVHILPAKANTSSRVCWLCVGGLKLRPNRTFRKKKRSIKMALWDDVCMVVWTGRGITSPIHTARWSRKIARKLPECLLCERKHVPGLIPGLIPGWDLVTLPGSVPVLCPFSTPCQIITPSLKSLSDCLILTPPPHLTLNLPILGG